MFRMLAHKEASLLSASTTHSSPLLPMPIHRLLSILVPTFVCQPSTSRPATCCAAYSAVTESVQTHQPHGSNANLKSASTLSNINTAYGKVTTVLNQYVQVELVSAQPPVPVSNTQPVGSQSPDVQLDSLPNRRLLCRIRGLLRKLSKNVIVGDYVKVNHIDWGSARAVVDDILPRHNELVDPTIANIDHALLVFALDSPPFQPWQVARFLVHMESAGLDFSVVLSKADLVSEETAQQRLQQLQEWGYDPILVSCATGQGIDKVYARLAGRTSVMAGPSGAGKSSLINTIRLGRHRPDAEQDVVDIASLLSSLDDDTSDASDINPGSTVCQEDTEFVAVGELSRIGTGKHKTTAVRLIKLPSGGFLADSPGFSQPALERASSARLSEFFPEFVQLTESQPCRFADCLHLDEPGCSVKAAGFERYEYYVAFLAELKEREQLAAASGASKRERQGATKVMTGRNNRRLEVRLEKKGANTYYKKKMRGSALKDSWQEHDEDSIEFMAGAH